MLNIKLITVGTLKEAYWRDAVAEYTKRLGGFCHVEEIAVKEARLPENPGRAEIAAALAAEAKVIQAAFTPRAYKVALCVEGTTLSSEALAAKLEQVMLTTSDICFVIGSSYGLDASVKQACDYRLSVSALTFPHQLMRVILLETVYRAFTILKGTPYHK